MTPENEKRAIAFIRSVGNRCMKCLHKTEERCQNCESHWANSILRDIDAEMNLTVDYSLFSRMTQIVNILKSEAKPTLSSRINLGGICSNQLKQWTLKRMVRIGLIGRRLAFRTKNGYCVYKYFLKKQETKQ